ncbi:MAG: VCBS repeat-containing protein, partial [Actinobacteria bacterium]
MRVMATVLAALLLLAACGGSEASADRTPHFVDETASSGLDHRYDGEFEFFVGGGVAAFDCDDDGRDELFLAGGTEPAALFHNDSVVGGALSFSPVPSPVTDLPSVTGGYPLDLDSDGQTDLVVLGRDGDVVLRGLCECRFEPADDELGLDLPSGWTTAFSATWEESNVLPTLAFGRYLTADREGCDDSWLLRPAESGDAYAAPIAL